MKIKIQKLENLTSGQIFNDKLWQETFKINERKCMICVSCLEKRLGRKLLPSDFNDTHANLIMVIKVKTQETFVSQAEIKHIQKFYPEKIKEYGFLAKSPLLAQRLGTPRERLMRAKRVISLL